MSCSIKLIKPKKDVMGISDLDPVAQKEIYQLGHTTGIWSRGAVLKDSNLTPVESDATSE